ncbi:MAG TPA: hypothetical protein VGJ74_20615 [Burkholderiales bacterium]|jgi:hypothetical protein
MAKPLSAEVVEAMLAAQDIPLAPGRAERLAPGVNALNMDDPLRAKLAFEVDATTYLIALSANK